MNKILFTYDLNREIYAAKRQALEQAIVKAFPTYWRRLTTTWIVVTPLSAVQVRDWLAQFLDANDELFVADLSSGPIAWSGMDAQAVSWLQGVFGP